MPAPSGVANGLSHHRPQQKKAWTIKVPRFFVDLFSQIWYASKGVCVMTLVENGRRSVLSKRALRRAFPTPSSDACFNRLSNCRVGYIIRY